MRARGIPTTAEELLQRLVCLYRFRVCCSDYSADWCDSGLQCWKVRPRAGERVEEKFLQAFAAAELDATNCCDFQRCRSPNRSLPCAGHGREDRAIKNSFLLC